MPTDQTPCFDEVSDDAVTTLRLPPSNGDDAVTTLLQHLTDVRLAEASYLVAGGGLRIPTPRTNDEAAALAAAAFAAWLRSDQVRDMVATWMQPIWDAPRPEDILGLLAEAAETGSVDAG